MNRPGFSVVFVIGVGVAASACFGSPPQEPYVPAGGIGAGAPGAPPPTAPTPEPPRETPDAPFRQHPPAPDGKVTFTAPKIVEAHLKNGVRVLVSERHDLPIVSVRLVVTSGAGDLAGARPGAASFLGGMLEQGTKKRSALQLSDEFEAIGAQISAWVDWDSGGVSMKVLADKLDAGLELMSDVALHPTFPDDEIERFRARRIATLQAEKVSPSAASQKAIAAALFGRAHRYGHPLAGDEADAKKLTKAELVDLYGKLFVPENAAILVAGDVTQASILPKLESAFGAWKPSGRKPPSAAQRGPQAPAKAATDKKIVLVDRPGAQSQIALVRVGVPFERKDRDAIVVTNAILGGMFTSRVNMNLREKHAYTYGARSYFVMRHGAGPLYVGAPVFADKTVPAIKETIGEVDGLRTGGPSDDEMALAKESLLLAMPGRFETVDAITNAMSEIAVYDLPLDEFEKRPARIEAVTAADVKKVAGDFFDSKTMTLVVVGDKAKLAGELEALGLGGVDERDPYGDPVAAAAQKK